ncbi:MAG: DUF4082 domain-containing protein [Vicinamibacterales bacterium]
MSVNQGDTVRFKVKTDAASYTIDVYRLGYYGGLGARLVASIAPAAPLPQLQPACANDPATGLVDCGNWQESASWQVPAQATSGIYVAKLTRLDTHGSNHIYFVVRADNAHSDVLFQTSDTTWQAYNTYGGNSLYAGAPVGRAYKVSYNRPFNNRAVTPRAAPFYSEYPMVRWLEANGFDVSYSTGIDTDRRGAELLEHKAFLSVGHDEYWSGGQRTNVETARAAGVHLAFFSGNEMFWKTRWEASIDGSGTPYRTLVSYKETHANQKIDPDPAWTGTWRDDRFSPPSDGGRPENGLTGTLFTVECCTSAIHVGDTFGHLRFWRNTSVATLAPGTTATLAAGSLGYEWNEDVDNGHRPAGLMQLSSTTLPTDDHLLDLGSTYGPGTATHSLTLYRHPSGAWVFSAGTIQWSWGLDLEHDQPTGEPESDANMEQATVNLLADMGAQAATLKAGLMPASASTDGTPPSTTITSPVNGSDVEPGGVVTITGTASDDQGTVAAVEVSVDGGSTWHPATGREAWSYPWSPTSAGSVTIKARAIDDSGNLEPPSAETTVTVTSPQCPCSIWNPAADLPAVIDAGDPSGVELGVKFRAGMSGFITGLRFYKSTGNTGTHVGNLWTQGGTLLGTATFVSENASGWQQVSFSTPIAITANAVYVASYHTNTGHYSATGAYFASAGVDTPPLHALGNVTSTNGVYRYGPTGFPTSSYNATNYWVDVVFNTSIGGNDTTPPTVVATTPSPGATGISTGAQATVTFSEPADPATVTAGTIELRAGGTTLVPSSVAYDAPTRTATLTPSAALIPGTTYSVLVHGGGADPRVKDLAGNALAADLTVSFTTVALTACPCTLWPAGTVPAIVDAADPNAVELGVKFRADTDGFITGVRFYKSAANTGVHVGNLWTGAGTLLATATFVAEGTSGWQQVFFSTPVAVVANTTYVASYHTNTGHYSASGAYFATAGVDAPPLHALANVSNANGVYRYGSSAFPSFSYNAANYWVDVVFETSAGTTDTTPPTVVSINPAADAIGAGTGTPVSVTFSEPIDPATVTTNTVELRDGATLVLASVTYDGVTRTATLTPNYALANGTTYSARVHGGSTGFRVKDLAGNALAADFTASFTTATPAACPCSLWPAGTGTPAIVDVDDSNAVELGVKFRADTDGFITGIRFYKSAANTGTHVGSLWTSGGTLLSSATFTSESTSGWQVVSFPAPVAVTANTTYVASYHTNSGHYSYTGAYFGAAGVDQEPLHALANSSSANGVYRYGAIGFPSSSYNAANYWVDVVFDTGASQVPSTSFVDTTTQDFAAGQHDVGAYVAETGNGEVMLAPVVGAEFGGSILPAGWISSPWGGSSTTVIGNGMLAVDGAWVSPQFVYSGNRSLEFAATFSGAPYQHVGYGVTFSEALWAIFSSGPGDALYVRTNDGFVSTNTALPGSWFGVRHQFRIDWTPAGIAYFIDGAQVAFHAQSITSNLRPIASDYAHDGSVLAVDWLRLTPYASLQEGPGIATFTSRTFDASSTVTWTTAAWNATTPAGTSVVLSVRYGATPTPDGSWTLFTPVTGGTINVQSRYLQYRLSMSTTNPNQTPVVSSVTLNFSR